MELLVVRHGESDGNADGRLQGSIDSPLSPRGKEQARRLARWLNTQRIGWDVAYSSPLSRALETARLLSELTHNPLPTIDPDLREIDAGSLEGLNRNDMEERYPDFLKRAITNLGDFAEYGGEGYDHVQQRVQRLLSRLLERHRDPPVSPPEGRRPQTGSVSPPEGRRPQTRPARVLLAGHGGVNFQLVKAAISVPVPRVCILHWGNCTACLLRFRERRGLYMGEVAWHVPLELMGGDEGEGITNVFR